MGATDRSSTGEVGAEKGIAERVIAVLNREKSVGRNLETEVPVLGSALTAREMVAVIASGIGRGPGQVVIVPIRIVNEGSEDASVQLKSTDLVSAAGDRIDAELVSFDPELSTIAAGGSSPVGARVSLPADAPPGRYAGLLGTKEQNAVPALLIVGVE